MLAYEAAVRGWLTPADGMDFIGGDVNFAKLKAAGVRFYDDTKTALPPLPPPKAKPQTLDIPDLLDDSDGEHEPEVEAASYF